MTWQTHTFSRRRRGVEQLDAADTPQARVMAHDESRDALGVVAIDAARDRQDHPVRRAQAHQVEHERQQYDAQSNAQRARLVRCKSRRHDDDDVTKSIPVTSQFASTSVCCTDD